MKQEFLKFFPHLEMTIAGLVVFLLVFTAVILRVTVFKNKELQEAVSKLPLDDEGGRHVG